MMSMTMPASLGAPQLMQRRALGCSAPSVPLHRARCGSRHAAGSSARFVVASTESDADAELERRLQDFKGTKSWKQAKKEEGKLPGSGPAATKVTSPAEAADWGEEIVFQEGPPSSGDLAVNLVLGATLLWLPLTLAAVGRYAWVNYKITNKRVSVKSTSPLNSEQLDASYAQMKEVRAIGRGLGYWGDMVIVLEDGAKIEMRSVDKWQEVKAYIEARIAEAQATRAQGEETAWLKKTSKRA